MGTNYYFMSRNKELMQTCFAEKSKWGVLGEEYTIVDEPYLGYWCHLNKLSCGWRPLFQKHRAFDSFRKLEAFYREHQADLEIYDEAGGMADRGTFVINPEGRVVAYEVNAGNVGRNADELLRKVEALQFVAEHGDEVCPAKWTPGAETLKPTLDLVGLL